MIDGAGRCSAGLTESGQDEDLNKGTAFLAKVQERFPVSLTPGLWIDMNKVSDHLQDVV